MAVTLSRGGSEQVEVQRKSQVEDDEIGNINNNNNNNNNNKSGGNKRVVVAVVYYLCRNGQLEHPHFMEVPLSSSHGLFLRDVLLRFNLLRSKSMAFLYSWSSKRSYKNGYVWHDLQENDYIHPLPGGDYVLKGSEILETASLLLSSPSLSKSPERSSSSNGNTNVIRRRNQSWGAIHLHEYKVYKTESSHEFAAADASTQTDEKRRRRKAVVMEEPEIEEQDKTEKQQQSTELSGGEISPPPSDSSPETLESLMKADGKLIINSNYNNTLGAEAVDDEAGEGDGKAEYYCPNGRMKASSVIMSVISCGSISFRECGETAVGMGRVGGGWNKRSEEGGKKKNDKEEKRKDDKVRSRYGKMRLEDKEYYSGSLIETKNSNYKEDDEQLMYLKRSSSYNADHRSCHMKLEGKEEEGVRAKCIPRKQKAQPNNKKQSISQMTTVTVNTTPQTAQAFVRRLNRSCMEVRRLRRIIKRKTS